MKVVRSTEHSLSSANLGKSSKYSDFCADYKRLLSFYVDYLWNTRIEYGNGRVLDVKNEKLEVPKMYNYKNIDIPFYSPLSARAKSCCLDQALGMLSASLEKQRRRQYHLDNKQTRKKYEQVGFTKPSTENANIELRSLCACIVEKEGSKRTHDWYVVLKSLGKEYGKISIPLKNHKRSKYWQKQGFTMLGSFLFTPSSVQVRWEKEVEEKTEGETLGADQGLKDTMTFSNGITTPKVDKQGKTIDFLMEKLSRKRKGSKAFKNARTELDNFIHWQFNELKKTNFFDGVKAINLEKIWNIRFKKRTSRLMSHWSNPKIVEKFKRICEVSGVHIYEESSTYMSQRCSRCGLVKKSNRKKKVYKCPHCGMEIDSDLNASINHTLDLPPISYSFRRLGMNRKGFFWQKNGLFDLNGEELRSPSWLQNQE